MDDTDAAEPNPPQRQASNQSDTAAEARHAPYLRQALAMAMVARQRGDHPFGALIVEPETGVVLCTGLNSVLTAKDCTGHVRCCWDRVESNRRECSPYLILFLPFTRRRRKQT
jgi:hypothetical protein